MTLSERLDAARIEWRKWSDRKAANKVKSTADWWLYDRAMRTYEDLLIELNRR
jgi:hypothetical protein